jgi:two-component system phosphate regulon response regulator PhoB
MYMAKRIHIVEDDEDIRYIVCYILTEIGYAVTLADCIADFKAQQQQDFRPDLILLDVMLPDGNGLELCLELKNSPATRDIPVIIMSAHATEAQVLRKVNADEFIGKPFDLDELTELIKKHIS